MLCAPQLEGGHVRSGGGRHSPSCPSADPHLLVLQLDKRWLASLMMLLLKGPHSPRLDDRHEQDLLHPDLRRRVALSKEAFTLTRISWSFSAYGRICVRILRAAQLGRDTSHRSRSAGLIRQRCGGLP